MLVLPQTRDRHPNPQLDYQALTQLHLVSSIVGTYRNTLTVYSGGHEALAHKDFLDSATEAVSQTERPNISDHSVCLMDTSYV